MSNLVAEIAYIEKELLKLTGNQPPNPRQIKTFIQDHSPATDLEEKAIVFEDGLAKFVQVYLVSGNASLSIVADGPNLRIVTVGTVPYTYRTVSIGAFHLV